jgi:outer membrane protein
LHLPLLASGDLLIFPELSSVYFSISMKRTILFFTVYFLLTASFGQPGNPGGPKSLEECIVYALNHQTNIRQSVINEQITEREIKVSLSDWYPQIGFSGNYQYNFQRPTAIFNNSAQQIGTTVASGGFFGLNQTIFNREVVIAQQSAGDVRLNAKQNTTSTRIDVVSNVSKAFYDLLLSQTQIVLLDTDIVLLQRSLKDAYNQYKGGLVDKTDYQRATISLNNARALHKSAEEQLKSRAALLKLYMSYPVDSTLQVAYDSAAMLAEILSVDTLQTVDVNNRIEYQQLITQKRLEQDNLKYYKWGFLPSVSAFGQYNLNYYSDQNKNLYQNNYPNSYAGLSISIPIFTGTRRLQEVRIARLQLEKLDYNFTSLKDSINAQYIQAMSAYKANLNNFFEQKENLSLAREVYNIIMLQYRAGIKTYLDVVTANNDLFNAQIFYTNAIFQVLSNKIDVERALGTLKYSY